MASSETEVRWVASSTTFTPSRVDRVAQPEEEDRELLLQVGGEQEHRAAGRAHLVDGGAREAEHDLGRQPVAELGVDVVGAEHALGELGPGVGALVGEPGAAEHRDLVGGGGVQGGGRRRQRLAPRHLARARRPVAASGAPRRSSLFTEPNPKRPRSQSQPQFTGSTSTPW